MFPTSWFRTIEWVVERCLTCKVKLFLRSGVKYGPPVECGRTCATGSTCSNNKRRWLAAQSIRCHLSADKRRTFPNLNQRSLIAARMCPLMGRGFTFSLVTSAPQHTCQHEPARSTFSATSATTCAVVKARQCLFCNDTAFCGVWLFKPRAPVESSCSLLITTDAPPFINSLISPFALLQNLDPQWLTVFVSTAAASQSADFSSSSSLSFLCNFSALLKKKIP